MTVLFETFSQTPYDEEEIICWMEFSKMNKYETFYFLRISMKYFPSIEAVISLIQKSVELEKMGSEVKSPIYDIYKEILKGEKDV